MLIGALTTLHEGALLGWIFTVLPLYASLTAGCMLITVCARRTMVAVIVSLAPPLFFVGVPMLLRDLPIFQGPSMLVGATLVTAVLFGLRRYGHRRRRSSALVACLIAIFMPLLCLLIMFGVDGGWTVASGYGAPTRMNSYTFGLNFRSFYGPWHEINYTYWLLGPFDNRWPM